MRNLWETTIDPAVSNSPILLYVLLAVSVVSVVFGAVNRGTSGVGAWLSSLRRIGSDAKAADLSSKQAEIANLAQDLETERRARQADRQYFDKENDRRDSLIRDHIQWDWKVYNVLVLAGLLDKDGSKPPPLH